MNNTEESVRGCVNRWLWIFPVLVPFLILVLSFVFGSWNWGLMDDLTVLQSGTNAAERFLSYFRATMQFGQFKPFYALYTGIGYSIFEDSPKYFYIAKAVFAFMVLFIWGAAASFLSKTKIAFFLVPAIALSFHYFYDVFFYLSSHEIVGLFFLGLTVHCFIRSVPFISQDGRSPTTLGLGWLVAGILFLYCAFLSKEPFVSCGIAFGFAYVYLAFLIRRRKGAKFVLLAGLLILGLSLGHALFLNFIVKKQYTAGYALTNMDRIISSAQSWLKKDFFNHLPWIIAGGILFRKKDSVRSHADEDAGVEGLSISANWGVALGVLLYVFYVLILLPWSTITYYATPLGLFFAFFMGVFLAARAGRMTFFMGMSLVLFSLCFNMLVVHYALSREAVYQYDTQNLMNWFKEQPFADQGSVHFRDYVLINAMESADAIPGLINHRWGKKLPYFQYSLHLDHLLHGQKSNYFVYTPRFSPMDSEKFSEWEKVFLSNSWVVYRRLDEGVN